MGFDPQTRLRSLHTTAWTLTGAAVVALTLPWLFRRGMYWDGVVYSTAARNLAAGFGDTWHLSVTLTYLRHFHEHPPLAFWLQAAFFRVLGDHIWVERFYCLTTLVATGWGLLAIWRRLLGDRPGASACSWVPVCLWMPIGLWCYRNNVLENTMGMFTTLSLYATLRAMEGRRGWAVGWTILSGLAITAAIMSKGPVGLFPVATPAIAWLTLRSANVSKALLVQSGVLCSLAVAVGLVLMGPQAREYLAAYWQQQVVSSMRGQREVMVHSVAEHFRVGLWFARQLLAPAALVGVLSLFARMRYGTSAVETRPTRAMWFCLLTALSASLPIMVSPKQGGFYFALSLPFYMFALALWCMPALVELASRLATWSHHTTLRYVAGAVVVGAVLVSALTYGTTARDRRFIELVDQLGQQVAPHTVVAVTADSWDKIPRDDRRYIHSYLHRYHEVSIWADEPQPAGASDVYRLLPPTSPLVRSGQRIVLPSGLECYPLELAAKPSGTVPVLRSLRTKTQVSPSPKRF